MKKTTLFGLAATAGLAINAAVAGPTIATDAALAQVRAKAQVISQMEPDLVNKITQGEQASLTTLGLVDPWSMAAALEASEDGNIAPCGLSCCCSKSC